MVVHVTQMSKTNPNGFKICNRNGNAIIDNETSDYEDSVFEPDPDTPTDKEFSFEEVSDTYSIDSNYHNENPATDLLPPHELAGVDKDSAVEPPPDLTVVYCHPPNEVHINLPVLAYYYLPEYITGVPEAAPVTTTLLNDASDITGVYYEELENQPNSQVKYDSSNSSNSTQGSSTAQ